MDSFMIVVNIVFFLLDRSRSVVRILWLVKICTGYQVSMLLQRGRFENYMVIDLTSGKKIFLCVPVSLLLLCPEAQGDPSEEAVLEAGAGEAVHSPEAGPEAGGDLVTESGG